MTESTLREPEQICQDCARKLRRVKTTGMFRAILGYMLGEDWTRPRIKQLMITDHRLLARLEGEVAHRRLIGAEKDLIRNVHRIVKAAGLDGDEVGYLLGKIAEMKRVE